MKGIRAVGSLSISEQENKTIYKKLLGHFEKQVRNDLKEPLRERSVLDLGYGQGHYARACQRLGIGRYVGLDFAAPPPFQTEGYVFKQVDIGRPGLQLDQKFDLVLLIDVAFHLVNEQAFMHMLHNVKTHANNMVYVTGLFRDINIADHVRHRALHRFLGLGKPLDVYPWRDTLLLRLSRA